jgi:hypothetical protein
VLVDLPDLVGEVVGVLYAQDGFDPVVQFGELSPRVFFWFWPPVDTARKRLRVTVSTL